MDLGAMSSYAVSQALSHVAQLSRGRALDRSLRVTLNFHPDRLHGGRPILLAMARDGVYKSQFETRTSNGGLTAFPGGDRWLWESRIFGGWYNGVDVSLRPKYGALNHRHRRIGGAPRFGSAHFRLSAHVLDRSSFCFPDSVFEPEDFGVAPACNLPELVELTAPEFLDDYVEAHVHGVVDLETDVEAVVLDPCYRGTPVEEHAAQLPCPVEWHGGFRLAVDQLRSLAASRDPRLGPVQPFVRGGLSLARDGVLTPRHLGDAVRAGRHPEAALKRVWFVLARFGQVTPAG
jgi:hypothetical protein